MKGTKADRAVDIVQTQAVFMAVWNKCTVVTINAAKIKF